MLDLTAGAALKVDGRAGVHVSTRGELVARVFFDHYAPRLGSDAPIDATGWFQLRGASRLAPHAIPRARRSWR